MDALSRFFLLSALSALAAAAPAQQADETGPPSGSALARLTGGAPRALGTTIAGPYDVETSTNDNRCLGVEEAWGHFWVTGRGHTTVGDNWMVHKFDHDGNWLASFPQVLPPLNGGGWGGRDLEADEAANTLWIGNDLGKVEVQTYDPVTGGLLYTGTVATQVSGTVRALCRDPNSGLFYTKSFTAPMVLFDMGTGAVVNSWAYTVPSAYGFGWDPGSGTLWSTDDLGDAIELDPATATPTGRSFTGLGGSQGGADVYFDARNPGSWSLVMLDQGTPDTITVYDVASPYAGGPVLAVSNLVAGQLVTITVDQATPNGLVRHGYSLAGGGPTSTPLGDLLLSPPFKELPAMTADGAGHASFQAPVPPAASGRTVWLHALDLGSLTFTNGLSQVIG